MFIYFSAGAGVTDVIAFIVFKPAEDLQKSRAPLAQLVSAFLTWFNDSHNWNGAIEKEINDKRNIDVLEKISKRSIVNTFAIIMAIDTFIERKDPEKASKHIQQLVKTFEEIKV
jgi:hypothetical protein